MTLKNGLFYEKDELIYYEKDIPCHAGVVRVDGDIYYISYGGKAVRGQRIVHRDMSNGILKHGTYTFGKDYKLVPGSYLAPSMFNRRRRAKTVKTSEDKSFRHIWRYLVDNGHYRKLIATLLTVVLIVGLVWFVSGNPISVGQEQMSSATQNNLTANEMEKDTAVEDVATETTVTKEYGVAEEDTVTEATYSENVQVLIPKYTEDVLLCSQAAKREYDGEITLKSAAAAGDPYRPFVFEYSFVNCSGTLWLGERADFSDATQYALPENQKNIEIHNLKVDTDYYYKVLVAGQEYLGNFHTALSTRFVYIPGLDNTRDIGGGTTLDGKKVKQGLLIRGVEPDGLVTVKYFIPDNKLEAVKREFNFVYDMDLRATDVYSGTFASRLGTSHKFYTAPWYGRIFNQDYHPALRKNLC